LLAGIGRVESDHGRYGGSQLGNDGLPRPAIVGIALDGQGPVAAIHDTDNGEWDGDPVWDRAVGPMQFIPGTWSSSGRDGDGDGIKNPNDIDDAALAAAYYLCPSSGSIRSGAAMDAAIRSYNNSDYYIDLVEAFARGYETGVFVIPSPPPAPGVSADAPKVKPKVTKVDKHGKPIKATSGKSGPSGSTTHHGGKTGGVSTGGHPSGGKPTGGATGGPTGGSTGGPSGGSSSPPPSQTPPPAPDPQPTAVSGVLTQSGEDFLVGGTVYDWRPGIASKKDQLVALAGQTVRITVLDGVVKTLNDAPW
jgi:hypothetical protein